MQITILTYGTRGDVQPYVALGAGFKRAGHAVRLAAPRMFERLVTEHDVEFVPLAGDPTQLIQQAVQKVGAKATLFGLVRVILEHAIPLAAQMMADCIQACEGTEAIIHSLLLTTAGYEIARRLDVPDFSALIFVTFAPTSAFPNQGVPDLPLGPLYNRLSHKLFNGLYWHGGRLAYHWVRRKHPELPRLTAWPFDTSNDRVTPILYGFSPQVIPKPLDWGEDVHVTGYWFLDAASGWKPPARLAEFILGGSTPVFVGFGSVINQDSRRLTEIVLAALAQAGQRAVLLSGWGGLSVANPPEDVFQIESVPFDWLFPRMKVAVHHGGTGTTSAALRAGIPSVIVPFTADQPYWGRRMHRLGLGPAPIPSKRLTVERLAEAIQIAATDGAMRQRAAEYGKRIQAEDGVGRAVEIVERYLGVNHDETWHGRN